MDRVFNPEKRHKRFLAVAPKGDGVLATLQSAIQEMIAALRRKVEADSKGAPAPSAAAPASADTLSEEPFPAEAPLPPPAEETEEQKILKMLYQFNENTLLLMTSILEDIQKQQEMIKTLIVKEK